MTDKVRMANEDITFGMAAAIHVIDGMAAQMREQYKMLMFVRGRLENGIKEVANGTAQIQLRGAGTGAKRGRPASGALSLSGCSGGNGGVCR